MEEGIKRSLMMIFIVMLVVTLISTLSFLFLDSIRGTIPNNSGTNSEVILSDSNIAKDLAFQPTSLTNNDRMNQTWLDFSSDDGDYIQITDIGVRDTPELSLYRYREFNNYTVELDFHQGIARSPTHIYLFDTGIVYKTLYDFIPISNFSYLGDSIYNRNHYGDGVYNGDKIYVPTEYWKDCSNFDNMSIMVFNASNMSFIEEYNLTEGDHEVSSIDFDDEGNYAYVTSYCNNNSIFQYNATNFSLITNISLSRDISQTQGIAINGSNIFIHGRAENIGAYVHLINLTGDYQTQLWRRGSATYYEGLDWNETNLMSHHDETLRYIYEIEETNGYFSTSMWINNTLPSENGDTYQRLLWTSDDSFALFYEKAQGDINLKFYTTEGTSPRPDIKEGNLTSGKWFNLITVYNGTNLALWVDGHLISFVNRDNTGFFSNFEWYISSTASFWNGSIDEVRIFNDSLTETEIIEINSSGRNQNVSLIGDKLVGYWAFNENNGTVAYDSSDNSNDGTISGATYNHDGNRITLSSADYILNRGQYTISNPDLAYSEINLTYNYELNTTTREAIVGLESSNLTIFRFLGLVFLAIIFGVILAVLIIKIKPLLTRNIDI
jgi:hypothetical protein